MAPSVPPKPTLPPGRIIRDGESHPRNLRHLSTEEVAEDLYRFDGYIPVQEIVRRLNTLDRSRVKVRKAERRARAAMVACLAAIAVVGVLSLVTIQLSAELMAHRAALKSWEGSCLTHVQANKVLDRMDAVLQINSRCIDLHQSNRDLYDTISTQDPAIQD